VPIVVAYGERGMYRMMTQNAPHPTNLDFVAFSSSHLSRMIYLSSVVLCALLLPQTKPAMAQGSASLGNGLSASAIARGGTVVAERGSALDAVEGDPAGLAGDSTRMLDLTGLGLVAGGSFHNSVNNDASLRGVAGALPFGALIIPIGKSHWTASAALTPEIQMRANWHYVDAPGTAGVT
jgi:hypothetical protein